MDDDNRVYRIGIPNYLIASSCFNYSVTDTTQPECILPLEILRIVLPKTRVKYQLVFFNEPLEVYKEYAFGRWYGPLGMLQNGSLDMIADLYSVTHERLADFVFAAPITYSTYGFIFQDTNFYFGAGKSVLSTFCVETWGAWALSLLVTALLITLASVLQNALFWAKIPDLMWHIIAKRVPYAFQTRMMSVRLNLLAYGILVLILLPLFRGTLLGTILVRNDRPPFQSTLELAKLVYEGQFTLATDDKHGFYMKQIYESDSGTSRMMRKALAKNPALFQPTKDSISSIVHNDSANLVIVENSLRVGHWITDAKSCGLRYIADKDFTAIWTSFIFNKNAVQFSQKISYTMSHYRHFINILILNSYPQYKPCNSREKTIPLKLSNLWSSFVFLVSGLLVALFALLFERFRNA